MAGGLSSTRVYINKEQENLFTWDRQSGSLQQMDGKPAFPVPVFKALSEKISLVLLNTVADK